MCLSQSQPLDHIKYFQRTKEEQEKEGGKDSGGGGGWAWGECATSISPLTCGIAATFIPGLWCNSLSPLSSLPLRGLYLSLSLTTLVPACVFFMHKHTYLAQSVLLHPRLHYVLIRPSWLLLRLILSCTSNPPSSTFMLTCFSLLLHLARLSPCLASSFAPLLHILYQSWKLYEISAATFQVILQSTSSIFQQRSTFLPLKATKCYFLVKGSWWLSLIPRLLDSTTTTSTITTTLGWPQNQRVGIWRLKGREGDLWER